MSKSGKAFRKNTSQTRMEWTFSQIRRINRHNLQPHNFVKLGTTKQKSNKPLCGLLADLADSTWPLHLWRVRKEVQAALAGGFGAAPNKRIFGENRKCICTCPACRYCFSGKRLTVKSILFLKLHSENGILSLSVGYSR